MTNILIVDDHQILRETLHQYLSNIDNLNVVATVNNTQQARIYLSSHTVDILLLDLSLPDEDGLSFAKQLDTISNNKPHIIFMSMHKESLIVSQALNIANSSYVSKSDSLQELKLAIYSAVNQQRYISTTAQQSSLQSDSSLESLSKRELEVLKLLASGLSQREISEQLFISLRTVETHLTRIRAKTNLRNSADLTRHAIKVGLILAN